jgi:hypothetical protein
MTKPPSSRPAPADNTLAPLAKTLRSPGLIIANLPHP